MYARFVSGVFLALGIADLAVLNLMLAPRLAADQAKHGAPETATVAQRPAATLLVERAAPRPPTTGAPEARSAPPAPPAPSSPPRPLAPIDDVRFDLQSELVTHPDAARALDRVAQELAADPARRLLLRGHADRLGRPGPNLALSRRRAEAVRRYLVMHGAPEDRIAVEAAGDTEPVDPGDTPSAWAKNRRVEVRWRK